MAGGVSAGVTARSCNWAVKSSYWLATSPKRDGRFDGRDGGETRMESLRISPRELSNRALIKEITGNVSILAKKELELAKAEVRADLKAELATIKALGMA